MPTNIFAGPTNLLTLDLSSNTFNTLSATIFSGLDSLETLLLNDNDLMTLPMNIFAGLTNLQALNMVDNPNPGKNYMFNLTLSRVDEMNAPSPASLSLQIAEGAPTALTFPIIVTGTATVTDNARNNITELTLTAGSTESDVFHVISAESVVVGLGSVVLPTSFTGVQFVVSDVLFLFSTVCDRTTDVANAIVAAVSTACNDVTTEHLAEITTLDLIGISSLQTGDFDGLTNLVSLDLRFSGLSELPANIFAGLINLETLRLNNNNLVTLSPNIFTGLTNLQTLLLNDNDLVTLPPNIFAGLTNLQTLLLNDNDLVTLPPNIFAGLINLQEFSIDNNPDNGDEFRLELTLNRTDEPDEAIGPAILVLELVEGAPAMITAQILVNGTPVSTRGTTTVTDAEGNPATELTLAVGFTVSSTIQISNTGPDKVTVTIGTVTTTPTSTVERGIEFVSNALELFPTLVCDRTLEVREAIVAAVPAACDEVTTEQLAEITTLTLSGTTSLQTGDFDGLTNLRSLDLSSGSLSELPEDIFRNLTALTDLDLSANAFSTLPPNIFADLTNLLTLDLSSNAFNTLSATIFSELTNLETLRLNGNDLMTLPTNIFAGLTNLLTLNLSSNTFSTLSATIFSELTSLETLLLNDNDMVTLPPNIFAGLTNLLTLDLSSNTFSTLSATIFSGLDSLENLQLNGNDLMTLPPNIFAGLTNLQALNMADNPDDDYMFNLTLSRVDNEVKSPASLSLQIAEGAPTALTFPIIVTGTATVTNDAGIGITELTLAAGSTESDVFHVISAESVVVGLNSAILPTSFTGVQFVVSDVLFLFSTVCDRTTEVVNAIVALVVPAANCDEVTAEHLAGIRTLDLSRISSLQTGDFDGLTNLVELDLSSGGLSELPANIFADLTNLETLRLNDNDLVTLPANIFADLTNLETLLLNDNDLVTLPPNIFAGLINLQNFSIDNNPDDDEFRLELILTRTDAPDEALGPATLVLELVEGAPAMITAQILVTGRTTTVTDTEGNPATELTLAVGFTVSSTIQISNTGPDKVTVTIGTVTTTPTSTVERGIEFVSNALELFPSSVCERTPAVINAIVAMVSAVTSCDAVTTEHLAEITTLDLSSTRITLLQTGDFDNLIALQTLNLASNELNDLPEDIFNSLTALINLDLSSNAFNTLSATIFSELTRLETLRLNGNNLMTLPTNIFAGLTNLLTLDLSSNTFNTLSATIFSELTSLETLLLNGNDLMTLPMNIFAGLTNLLTLDLSSNDFNTLLATIFSELTSLETLLLNDNDLMTLPMNIFAGLTNLQALNMADNPGGDYMFNLTLSRVDGVNYAPSPASLLLQIAEGAPTALTFPIIVTGTATVTDNAANNIDELTLTAGSTESDVFHVISTDVVAVGLGSVVLPTSFTGVQFVVSDVLFLFSTVCDRTPQVVNAIVSAVSDATSCDEVTTAQLAEITTLDLSRISSLQTGDFDGLTNLMELDLSSGGLSELPANIFADLTNLETLRLNDNDLVTLPANIFAGLTSLETLLLNDNDLVTLPPNIFAGLINLQNFSIDNNPDNNEFRLELTLNRTDVPDEAPGPATLVLELVEGAPTTISAQILVNGDPADPAMELILLVGSTVSNTIEISDTGFGKMTVTIGTVTTTPTSTVEHGIEFVSNTLELFPSSVCERTPAVINAIVAMVSAVTSCDAVTTEHLAGIKTLDLSSTGIISLQTGDFDNLIALQTLNLASNGLNDLPEDIFNSLTALSNLDLSSNAFNTLSATIFSELTSLKTLRLNGNNLMTLPTNIFAGLTNLLTLDLSSNTFNTLSATIFSELTNLETLLLNGNDLMTLPMNIFAGLTNLLTLDLSSNTFSTLSAAIFSELTSLETLLLNDNDLMTLPMNIFAGLTNLLTLDLSSNTFNTLSAAIFSELTSLETLLLNDNDLMTLPMNIFSGFTNLQTLNMADNPGGDYMFNLTLSRVDGVNYAPSPASLLLQIAEGAPTALTFPIIVTGTATVTDNAANNIDELTLTAGSTESDVFHVISTDVVAVGLGSAILPTSFTGVQFVVNDVLFLFSTVCDRTTEVVNAIVSAVSDATSCDEVTAEHLAGIRTLDLSRISSLQTGDFDGLTNLVELDLSSGGLSELPANIFADLTNLETLRLNDNDLVTLPANIFAGLTSLETLLLNDNDLVTLPPNIFAGLTNLETFSIDNNPDNGDEFRLELILTRTDAPDAALGPATLVLELVEGAPAMITAQILVTGGTTTVTDADDNPATELTLAVGFTVSSTIQISNTGPDKVTVTIGTVTTTPTSTVERGIEFVSNALELFPTSVCNRTPQVINAIVALVVPAANCDAVTTEHLAEITTLDLSSTGISSLQTGDFDNLIALQTLNLASNGLNDLPEDIFNSLTALSNLDLSSNAFNTLSATIFSELTSLKTLRLNGNDLMTLPMNIFAGLTNLLTLDLSSNTFNNTLPATIFSGLDSLETLLLNDNNISTLPATIFSGLTNLKTLNMENNPDNDYMFNLSLSRVDGVSYRRSPASLSLQIAEGAPTALTFPIIVTGTATVTDSAGNDITELTLAAGSIESDEFHVISTDVVAVGLDSAILPTGFTGTGVQFVVSDVLFLFSTVCDRTPQVANAIVAAVFDADDCDEITSAQLAEIRTLDLSGISSLKTGDFDGLTNLMSLDLSSGSLSELPTNIFDGLTNLVSLDLSSGDLSELPTNIFADLTNLGTLLLNGNDLVTLPANTFASLTNLETLLLNDNDLETLPPNIFAGLIGLNMLNLSDNPTAGNSYTFTLELTRTDGFNDNAPSPAIVSLRLDEGAPTKLSFSLAADNITISDTEVMTINAGSTESNTVRIERTGGAGKIMLAISEVVLGFPPQFEGMDLNTDDVLPLFPIPTVPVTPTVVVDPGNGQLTVSWNVPNDGNSPIKSFTVFVNRPGEDPSSTMVDASMSTYTIMSLSNGIEYSVRVVATNDVGNSPGSDPIIATPLGSFRFRIKVFLEGAQ